MTEDLAFFLSHKLLHTPALYEKIHKIHHENNIVFCLAAIHAHWIEYLLGNLVPLIVGPAILGQRIHRLSISGWFFVRVCKTIDAHSGYSFPWSPFKILPF